MYHALLCSQHVLSKQCVQAHYGRNFLATNFKKLALKAMVRIKALPNRLKRATGYRIKMNLDNYQQNSSSQRPIRILRTVGSLHETLFRIGSSICFKVL